MSENSVVPQTQLLPLSLSSLAREFGVARETVAKRLAAAGVKPYDEDRGHPRYRISEAAAAILELHSRTNQDDPDTWTPKEQLDFWRAKREKLKYAEDDGKVRPVEEFRAEIAVLVKIIAQALDILPDRLERELRLDAATLECIERHMDGIRAELAQALEQ